MPRPPGHSASADEASVQRPLPTKSLSVSSASSGIKVNQAAFIHKLYSMLEDDSIKHLISWTPSNVSFVISPGEEFSKVLSQYFKHTNPSSFVRQLNMYGFHKVNDTFHSNSSSSPDTAQWEFKHGQGSFKRGDVESLRAIKRRASRPSAIHRDNISLKSVSLSVPSTLPTDYSTPPPQPSSGPSSPGPAPPASTPQPYLPQHEQFPYYPPPPGENYLEARLSSLEHSLWTLRSSNSILVSKYNNLVESLKRTQSEHIHFVETVAKFVDPAKPEKSNLSFELNQIRNTLQMHSNNIPHLALDEHQTQLVHQRPPTTTNPVYSFQHPPTKQEISFGSSSRERAASIFYDPLAPAPMPSSPRQHPDDNAPLPTSAPFSFHHRQSAPVLSRGSPGPSTPGSPGPHDSNGMPPFQYGSSQPQSPQPGQPPTSTPQHHYYSEHPASPSAHVPVPPTRDQRPGSFPFISAYHTQRQQSHNSGPLIPSSNPYGLAATSGGGSPSGSGYGASGQAYGSGVAGAASALNNANKLRAEAMAPYRRHTSSEIIMNKPAPLGAMGVGATSHPTPQAGLQQQQQQQHPHAPKQHQPVALVSPPASTSRHNSYASSNSSVSSHPVAMLPTLSSEGEPASSSSPKKQAPPVPPAATVSPAPLPLPALRSSSSVQSLLNPTSASDLEPERKRLKIASVM